MSADLGPLPEPLAWGLFAKVEDGEWTLQHPVRFTEADAKADRSMYERSTMLDIRPLVSAAQMDAERQRAYAAGVAAERERCAMVAMQHTTHRDDPSNEVWQCAYNHVATEIAASIRSAPTKEAT